MGGRELSESFSACLVGEIEEETGLAVTVDALICAYPYEVLARAWVNVIVYGCEVPAAAAPAASSEHTATAFLDLDQLWKLILADGYREAINV